MPHLEILPGREGQAPEDVFSGALLRSCALSNISADPSGAWAYLDPVPNWWPVLQLIASLSLLKQKGDRIKTSGPIKKVCSKTGGPESNANAH